MHILDRQLTRHVQCSKTLVVVVPQSALSCSQELMLHILRPQSSFSPAYTLLCLASLLHTALQCNPVRYAFLLLLIGRIYSTVQTHHNRLSLHHWNIEYWRCSIFTYYRRQCHKCFAHISLRSLCFYFFPMLIPPE